MRTLIALTLALTLSIFLALPNIALSRRIHSHGGHRHHTAQTKASALKGGGNMITGTTLDPESYSRWGRRPAGTKRRPRGPDTLQVAGSSLPDCSHACGSCSPCRLVMVSFVCATLEEAETCPMAYKCMCRNKSFPVP
ncbi:hypothetical protein V2J09_019179 [Rumex salicifolius]